MQPWQRLVVVGGVASLSSMGGPEAHESSQGQTNMEQGYQVFRAYKEELRKHPDVLGVVPSPEGLLIITDRPAAVPTEVEGIPVVTQPPPDRLPPPPGVIVLKPDGTREERPDLDSCPEGYTVPTVTQRKAH